MRELQDEVRLAASRLHEALVKAREAGLVIRWPRRPEDLVRLAISQRALPSAAGPQGSAAPATEAGVAEPAAAAPSAPPQLHAADADLRPAEALRPTDSGDEASPEE